MDVTTEGDLPDRQEQEQASIAPRPGETTGSRRRRDVRSGGLAASLAHPVTMELAGLSIGAVGGAVLALVGALDQPASVIVVAASLLGLGAGASVAALRHRQDRDRTIRLLWAAVVSLGFFALGSVWIALMPDGTPVRVAFTINSTDQARCYNLTSEPGGGRSLGVYICGGETFDFECYSLAADGSSWLRVAGSNNWAQEAALHRVPVDDQRRLAECSTL